MTTLATAKLTNMGLCILQGKVAELNKRAKRLKVSPIEVVVLSTETFREQDPVTLLFRRTDINVVEVRGQAPRIEGWAVAALIEFSEAGNFVSGAPGMGDVNPEWRTVGNICQHCNKKRNRNDLIVIRHEDGREIIVGRNCLADYIRTEDAEALLRWASFHSIVIESINENDGEQIRWGRAPEQPFDLREVLRAASLCVRKFGYIKSNDYQPSTKTMAMDLLDPPTRPIDAAEFEKWVEKYDLRMTEIDDREAELAMEWLSKIEPTSDFLHTLSVLRDLNGVPRSKMGFAVSIIACAKRARDEEITRQGKAKFEDGFIGEPKQRLRGLKVEVVRSHSVAGNFGVTTIVTFRSEEGKQLTWFASGERTFESGDRHVITGTVKEHKSDAKFGDSTVLTRVVVEETVAS